MLLAGKPFHARSYSALFKPYTVNILQHSGLTLPKSQQHSECINI